MAFLAFGLVFSMFFFKARRTHRKPPWGSHGRRAMNWLTCSLAGARNGRNHPGVTWFFSATGDRLLRPTGELGHTEGSWGRKT